MRAYGLNRPQGLEGPDVGEIKSLGLKSSTGRFAEKGGDYKPYTRNAESRNATRRTFKRIERMTAKRDIQKDLSY